MLRLTLVAAMALVAAQDHAQHTEHSPYADETRSEIAALTAQDYALLRDGAGMGLAKAAELNGYPGPKHVLGLADELELTAPQRVEVEAAFDRMHSAAIGFGARILELEGELDRRFVHRHIDAAAIDRLTAEIGELQGRLRATHLVAHLTTTAMLTTAQISAYNRLRGYKVE